MTETERVLLDIAARVLRIDDLEPEDGFADIGVDSLQMIRLGLELEQRLHAKVPFGAIRRDETIASLAAWIDAGLPPRPAQGAIAEDPEA